jgi:hypothetical protein
LYLYFILLMVSSIYNSLITNTDIPTLPRLFEYNDQWFDY